MATGTHVSCLDATKTVENIDFLKSFSLCCFLKTSLTSFAALFAAYHPKIPISFVLCYIWFETNSQLILLVLIKFRQYCFAAL